MNRRRLAKLGCRECDIEPGRPVVNDWDRALFEPWTERKARLATEREGAGVKVRQGFIP